MNTTTKLDTRDVATHIARATMSTVSTAELVEYYNGHTGKSIKKFATRAKAEEAISKLESVVAALAKIHDKDAAQAAKKADTSAVDSALEIAKDRAAKKAEKDAAKAELVAAKAAAKAEKDAAKASERVAKNADLAARRAAKADRRQELRREHDSAGVSEVDATRSAAVAASWTDPAVKEARATRHGCKVDGVQYPSVLKAFEALALQISKHQKVRKELKAAGKLEFDGHTFILVTID